MLSPLRNALLLDGDGMPTQRHKILQSNDWDEVAASTDSVYMPFRVTPKGRISRPDSFHYTCDIGGFTLSRFRYGVAVALDEFVPEVGRGIALTTIHGNVRHCGMADTGVGESFLIDVSRADYTLDADPDHIQLNLSFPHQLVANLYERWHGLPAEEGMWRQKFKFGGPGSSWLALLEYCARCIAEMPDQVAHGPLGKHLEEMLGMNLLTQWSRHHGDAAFQKSGSLAPRFVKQAEQYMRDHAREAPTLTEIAAAVGVSVRALTGGFQSFRGQSPIAFMRELRLQGVRADLMAAPPGTTVYSVIAEWGYVNQGNFGIAYARRFGELPSQSLRRLRA